MFQPPFQRCGARGAADPHRLSSPECRSAARAPEGPASARSADFLTRQSWLALLGAAAASRDRLETVPPALRVSLPLRPRASSPERPLNDIQDRLSENELASFFHDLADAAG